MSVPYRLHLTGTTRSRVSGSHGIRKEYPDAPICGAASGTGCGAKGSSGHGCLLCGRASDYIRLDTSKFGARAS